ncbi:FkbM family methyltransferase [bacterium]|nr:FkbM family methyltransferase [bacterium]MBU3930493.1 FkbM family methyltransferase [bacterium]
MLKALREFRERIKRFYHLNIKKDKFMLQIYNWKKIDGDKNLRFDYDLNTNSIIFDVGGYVGDFTAGIFCKYNCNVYVFEPINEYYKTIVSRFANNKKVKVINSGLAGERRQQKMSVDKFSSSEFKNAKNTEKVNMISIADFIRKNNIGKIELLKVNIEGGEYELLESLLNEGLISSVKYIQVQYHRFIKNAEKRRENINKRLAQTHKLMWNYPFVWESWEIKIAQESSNIR